MRGPDVRSVRAPPFRVVCRARTRDPRPVRVQSLFPRRIVSRRHVIAMITAYELLSNHTLILYRGHAGSIAWFCKCLANTWSVVYFNRSKWVL